MASLNQILNNAIWDNKEKIRVNHVEIHREHLPELKVNSYHIRLVLREIISRSILNKKKSGVPRLIFKCYRVFKDGHWLFVIMSNDKGYPDQYDLFSEPKFIQCQEIIEKHRGTLTYKSYPGKGTVFNFTLPYDTITL